MLKAQTAHRDPHPTPASTSGQSLPLCALAGLAAALFGVGGPALAAGVDADNKRGAMCVARPDSDEPPVGPATPTGVIFQSDFSADTGYAVLGTASLWNGGRDPVSPPTGWDAVKAGGDSRVEVISGAGDGGDNALKLTWSPGATQPTVSLGKHLTGNEQTGYDELYIRYKVRLPNKFAIGDRGKSIGHWKWGRLWQNTNPNNERPNHWTENRENSGYVVWNFSGNVPYTMTAVTWSENSGSKLQYGSSGGNRQKLDYFVSGSDQHTAFGYFESLWDINTTDRPGRLENNTNQRWHTVEWRFKLATSDGADDGIFEMWWDGVNQGNYARLRNFSGAPERSGIPTANRGSGFNFLTVFDNLRGWNKNWGQSGVDGHIFVDDVVISTSRIGHEYKVGR